ncbi:hypothetical protein V865_000455 [Kwoniella europaea PYCC6329]|uniref:Uncharacterized protein n=1 Tax=Kwoniella europaea PYCC6329 TaxID=1423913 RepID=A0AAX4K7K9_9TREE
MPLLPSYQKNPKGDEESLPLFDADSNEHDELPAYPPRLGESSGSTTHNVTYTFVPRWPIKGEQKDALGVLGDTKEETISIVQRAFPILSTYPPNKIEISSLVEIDVQNGSGRRADERWCMIMDEAWSGFRSNPPKRLRVQIADDPRDEEKRMRRERWHTALTILAITSPFILFFLSLFYLALNYEDN